jgi:hypothetical protein
MCPLVLIWHPSRGIYVRTRFSSLWITTWSLRIRCSIIYFLHSERRATFTVLQAPSTEILRGVDADGPRQSDGGPNAYIEPPRKSRRIYMYRDPGAWRQRTHSSSSLGLRENASIVSGHRRYLILIFECLRMSSLACSYGL